jgi:hypothetical protein
VVAAVDDSGGQDAGFMHVPHIPVGIVTLTLAVPLHPTLGLKPTNRQVPMLSRPTNDGRRLGATTAGIAAWNGAVGRHALHRGDGGISSSLLSQRLFYPASLNAMVTTHALLKPKPRESKTTAPATPRPQRALVSSRISPHAAGLIMGPPTRPLGRPLLVSFPELLNPHRCVGQFCLCDVGNTPVRCTRCPSHGLGRA